MINDDDIFLSIGKELCASSNGKEMTKKDEEPASKDLALQQSNVPHPSGQVIVKEMFCHTKLKIYPDGSIFFTITGRPKDFDFKPKERIKAKPKEKAKIESLENY